MNCWRLAPLFLVSLILAPQAQADSVLDTIRARGVLRVGTTGDYKPWTFRNTDGTYTGADIVMAQHLAHELGVKVDFVQTTWSTLLSDFVAHKYDVAMGGVSILPDRAAEGEFSTPIYIGGKRPIVRCADQARFSTVAAIDQPEVRVVEPPGGSNEAFARTNFGHAQLTIHSDNTTIFNEIIAGRADVMVTDGIEVDHQVYLHPELCGALVATPFSRVVKAYLLPKDTKFVKFVDNWIVKEMSSGDWQRTLTAALRRK